MNYKETLMMPSNFSYVTDEEMEYLDGGKPITLDMNSDYLSRKKCTAKAEWLLTYGYCNNMDVKDVAKEIFGHAVAAFYGTTLAIMYPAFADTFNDIASHGWDGIQLEDKKDSRAWLFDICWVAPVGLP